MPFVNIEKSVLTLGVGRWGGRGRLAFVVNLGIPKCQWYCFQCSDSMGTVNMGILLGLYLFIVGMHQVLLIEELVRLFVEFLFTYICVHVCTYFKFFI